MDEWLDFTELIDNVQELIDIGMYNEALKLLEDHITIFNNEWEIYFLFSRIYTEQNQPHKAIPFLHRALRINRTNADCLLGLFYANAMIGQVKKGGKYLLRAEKYHPENEYVISALIWYFTEINDFKSAIDYFENAQSAGSLNPETFRNGGLAYQRAGENTKAIQCFKTALELNPQFDEVRDLLADYYLFTGDSVKSVELYREALRESPKNIRHMSRLVFCLTQNNQADQAETIARESIRLYPNSPVGYVDLAYVYLNCQAFDKALATAEQALDISPLDAEAFRVKGLAYSELGDNEKVQNSFERAIALDHENPEILRDYYHHLRETNQYEKMEKLVHQVIKLEYPYCLEDYWFLADYYRGNNKNLKAFHYLRKAYKSMPAERELLPPMIDILLDEGHVNYSFSFMVKYVEKSGWDDIVNHFSHHKQLRSKLAQEGIRFLRFRGERQINFRQFIFSFYLKRFLAIFSIIIFSLSLLPLYLLTGTLGMITFILFTLAFVVSFGSARRLLQKRARFIEKTEKGAVTPIYL